MLVGIDFDNTLARYHRAFHAAALARGWIADDVPIDKTAVRDRLRAQPGGEGRWVELQFEVYTAGLAQAELPVGARRLLDWCREAGVAVAIVSHKPEFAAADHGHSRSLRTAARAWIAAHGLDAAAGAGVWFEDTRAAKAARVASLGCTHHLDDLPEVFADPAFPGQVRGLLIDGDAGWDAALAALRDDHAAERMAASLAGMPAALSPLPGGGNARLWRARLADGSAAVLKRYRDDGRRRDATEVAALRLCAEHGLAGVPLVLGAADGWALLTALPGGRPQPPYRPGDLDGLAAWAGRFWALSRQRPVFAPASEACLEAGDLPRWLARRRARCEALGDGSPALALLRAEADPLIAAACRRLPDPPSEQDRCLSPSDFGFHNALRAPDGALALVDFEFFGWDDPAKLAGDALLHPGSALSPGERAGLRTRLLAALPAPALASRLAAMLPALCASWAMIVLNPLLAGAAGADDRLGRAGGYLALGHRLLAGKDLCDA